MSFDLEPDLAISRQVLNNLYFFPQQLISSYSVLHSSSFGNSHEKRF